MSIWQILLICLYLSSLTLGRQAFWFWAVMFVNLAATAFFDGGYIYVSMTDLACAAFLISRTPAASMVALIFSLMVPIYLVAWALDWQNYTTYAIIDLLAYIQCAIIGGIGGGFVNRYSNFIDRLGSDLGIVQARVYAESYILASIRKAG